MSVSLWPAPGLATYDEYGNLVPESGISIPTLTEFYAELVRAGELRTSGTGTPVPVTPNSTVELGGDVTGRSDANTVERIRNVSVDMTDASDGQVLTYKTGPTRFALTTPATGGAVDSVFGRTGSVTAQAGDYSASKVTNDSAAAGVTVADALEGLSADIAAAGDVYGPGSSTDNRLVRMDGATGKLIQSSAVTVDDSGNCSGLGTVACGTITITGNVVVSGTVDGRDVSTDGAVLDALVTGYNGKADKTITLVAGSGLSGGGDLSANRSFSVTYYSGTPAMNSGSGSTGVSGVPPRGDHVHPSDTSRVPTTRTVTAGTGLTGGGALSADITLSLSSKSTAKSVALTGWSADPANVAWRYDQQFPKQYNIMTTGTSPNTWFIDVSSGLPASVSAVTALTVKLQGAAGHSALPAVMPTWRLLSISGSTVTAVIATQTDASANTTAYQNSHTVSWSGSVALSAGTRYVLEVNGESGANSVNGLQLQEATMTVTYT